MFSWAKQIPFPMVSVGGMGSNNENEKTQRYSVERADGGVWGHTHPVQPPTTVL